MFSFQELTKILFLDIETVRCVKNFEDLSPAMQELWAGKAEQIKGEQSAEEKFYDRAAIYAEYGQIVCISCGFIYLKNQSPVLKLKSFYGGDESSLLKEFRQLMEEKFSDWQLCAHNGKEFDFPYLCRRMLIRQIALPRLLQLHNKKPWDFPLLDTMELWKFGDYKAYTKLELLCEVFGIPSPKTDMDGSKVGHTFWEEADYSKIVRYCEQDVIATAQLMMKYSLQPLIKVFENGN